MSLNEIREKNRLKNSIIYQEKTSPGSKKLEIPEEDREFYRTLMESSARTLSKHLDSEDE